MPLKTNGMSLFVRCLPQKKVEEAIINNVEKSNSRIKFDLKLEARRKVERRSRKQGEIKKEENLFLGLILSYMHRLGFL